MVFLNLFYQFFKIGLFTIGGGYAMIPLIQDVVVSQGWITQNQLVDFIAIAESTPGPFSINIATFVGMNTGMQNGGILFGILGACMTTIGVIMPSFIIILLIAKYFHTFQDNKFVKAGLMGLRPVVIGLIISAGFSIMLSNLFVSLDKVTGFSEFFTNHVDYKGIIIFGSVFLLSRKFKLHPILLIVISAVLGVIFYGLLPF